MKNKIELLKESRKRLALFTLIGALTLSGCGNAKGSDNNYEKDCNYYVITYNMDNAVIFEANSIIMSNTKINFSGIRYQGPYYVINNDNENSKNIAYELAKSLVGENGNITIVDDDNQLKLTK